MFEGAKPGVGLSATIDLEGDRIEEAELDRKGIVRVFRSSNYIPRMLLETHTFWEISPRFGVGPFCAVTMGGTRSLVGGMGAGIMFGMRTDGDSQSDNSFNVGLGGFVDPYVKTLGDGIKENEALPEGESRIRYKYQTRTGILILFSYAW